MKNFFTKRYLYILGVLGTLAVIGGYASVPFVAQYVHNTATIIDPTATKKLAELTAKDEEDQKLGQYVINMMAHVRADLTDAKKQILAHSIVEVSDNMFTNESDKKAFITMIAIESRFKRDAKSPTGAVGLTQIIPSYANDHGGPCGISDIKTEDLYDSDMNLAVGACYFRFVLERYNGDVYSALAAYNAGHNSKTAEVYSKSGDLSNEETLRYIAKFAHLRNNTSDDKPVVKISAPAPAQKKGASK